MYIYKNYELEHNEIEYMNMQYEIIWTYEFMKLYNLYKIMNSYTCTYNVYNFMN